MLCLLPFAWLLYGALTNTLGANPAEALIRATGDWTLRFICIVLTVTPLRTITNTPQLARFRRMLGLFVYFYVVIHLLSYSWFDMGFDVADIVKKCRLDFHAAAFEPCCHGNRAAHRIDHFIGHWRQQQGRRRAA